MLEKFKKGFSEFKSRIVSNIFIYDDQERGIEFVFVFGEEGTVEEWEGVFNEYRERRHLKLMTLGKIVEDAINRNQKGRAEFVDRLTSPAQGIIITKDARRDREKRREAEQFLININSMSETNLINMREAINNLQNKG